MTDSPRYCGHCDDMGREPEGDHHTDRCPHVQSTHSFGDGHDHGPCPTCGHDWKPCPTCGGEGRVQASLFRAPCPTCKGEGVVDVNTCPQDGIGSHYDCYHDCLTCKGTGKYVTGSWPLGMTARMADAPCPDCKGTGTAAAPAVADLVYCDTYGNAYHTYSNGKHPHQTVTCGPHRTLLLGPEVEA